MTSPAINAATPEGPGSASGAPNLPQGFTDTFTSRYIDAGGLRQHAVIGGDGPPLLLVHGWPQTWYAWRLVMPALAEQFEVIAPDQRGIGLTDKARDGYDAGTLAADLVALMDALGHERFAIYGTDTGMPIAYALAADRPERVERLVVSESLLPGVTPSPPLFVPPALNNRLWHLMFNRLDKLNEQLVVGREDLFFGAEFEHSAGRKKLPDAVVKHYADSFAADPESLRGSFEFYRAVDATRTQNEERKARPLTIPVLAIGGDQGGGDTIGNVMKLVADDVETVVLPESGHWVAEEAPEELVRVVTSFLAPYGEGAAATTAAAAAVN